MSQGFRGWEKVAEQLRTLATDRVIELNDGQAASLRELAERLPTNGVIIADEVGMGKTRIAAAVARTVIAAGGRVAILVPPGLGYQWSDELQTAGVNAPPILRSLWQYLKAWETRDKNAPWFKESALIVSHAFTNWRLGENTAPWRWALLPEIYARWRKANGRWPRDYCSNKMLDDVWVRQAAESIVSAICASPEKHPTRELIQKLAETTPWPGALTAGEYGRNAQLRPWLERAVGLGLGVFDLVIVDEAHKSRGEDSGLNRLLTEVVLKSDNTRCIAMTATPVELDATQWTQMLGRIQVKETPRETATTAIANYAQAVAKVRQCPSDKDACDEFKKSATAFKSTLNNYLLRRDKREDPAVIKFQNASGEGYHAYRREQEILIDTAQLSAEWKQAVCAAEALSFVTRQSDHTVAKRLRLTLGNGHGIASLIDQRHRDDKEDQLQSPKIELTADKRLLRAEWWQNVMIQPFATDGSALFNHPAILAAVGEIESVCRQGEKVLVFGRFTRPLRALVQLLNAREMLRCVDAKLPWPQSKVHGDEEWTAMKTAHLQLSRKGDLDRKSLDDVLAVQYQTLENQRRDIREKLISHIEEGFNCKQPDQRVRALFDVFKEAAKEDSEQVQDNDDHALAVVARAMQELVQVNTENATSSDFAQAFIDLVAAASDRDEGDADGDGQLDEAEASDLWDELKIRLQEEYNSPEGGYARLMYGETKPATRRFLQLAFNRKQGHPKVLVAQSLVGREGLNLHKACRTVVLLHPEWNPGVVEQQIGRVDRIGSLWEEKLNQAIADKQGNEDIPRIQIRPVVFRGTYDEKNWQVLHDRWDDLRAQLHGIVISPRVAAKYPDSAKMIDEINSAAPNFSPNKAKIACEKSQSVTEL
jgi:superfamily II DNA or RNA helicase